MMKRLGYRAEVAGGIKATASTGGQITPLLTGAGLFLMSELLGIPLGEMMLIAFAPAILLLTMIAPLAFAEAALRLGLCASILTGQLCRAHGVHDNGIDLDPATGERGFAGALDAAGYEMAFFGKAHFSTFHARHPTGSPESELSPVEFGEDGYGP